jgi:hypothetical protein
MNAGSFTTVGVVYGGAAEVDRLAAHATSLLGALFDAPPKGFSVRFVAAGERGVRVDLPLAPVRDRGSCEARLAQAFAQPWCELPLVAQLHGFGEIEAVLRPDAALGALTLDLREDDLFPDDLKPLRPGALETALKELLFRWFEVRPFERAFADHEAELDVQDDSTAAWERRYALVARPRRGSGEGAPLDFGGGGWRVSPHGGG